MVRGGVPARIARCMSDHMVVRPDYQQFVDVATSADTPRGAELEQFRKVIGVARRELRRLTPAARDRVGRGQTTKYFASGCGTMMALVDCSGSSWNSSVSFDADAVDLEQLHELRLVVEVRARAG